jgi:hypothetical protein
MISNLVQHLAEYIITNWDALTLFAKNVIITFFEQPIIDVIHSGHDALVFYLSNCTNEVLEAFHDLLHQ